MDSKYRQMIKNIKSNRQCQRNKCVHNTDRSNISNTVFGDNRLTAALVDRLIHHSHIIIFSGESYRLTQSMNRRRTKKGV